MARFLSLVSTTPAQERSGHRSTPSGAISWLKMPLSMVLFQISLVVLLLASGFHFKSTPPQGSRVTHDQPNPIHELYPNDVTGVLNATLVVVPIPLATARQIIPSQYAILEKAYRALLPDFPEGMYPLFVQAGHDHDIRYMDYGIADFNRAGYEFPFIDLLGDGYSSFRWHPEQMIEASNTDAVVGSRAYGTTVYPSTFSPVCDAYESLPQGGTYFNGTSSDHVSSKYVSLEFDRVHQGDPFPWSVAVVKNITNQPSFANGSSCDLQIRLFNASVSQGLYEPVPVKGQVASNLGPFYGATHFRDVFGYQLSTAFIEHNYLPCENFKGHEDTPSS